MAIYEGRRSIGAIRLASSESCPNVTMQRLLSIRVRTASDQPCDENAEINYPVRFWSCSETIKTGRQNITTLGVCQAHFNMMQASDNDEVDLSADLSILWRWPPRR